MPLWFVESGSHRRAATVFSVFRLSFNQFRRNDIFIATNNPGTIAPAGRHIIFDAAPMELCKGVSPEWRLVKAGARQIS